MSTDTEDRLRSALTAGAERVQSSPPAVQVIADAAAARTRRPAPSHVLLPAAAAVLVATLAGLLVVLGSGSQSTSRHGGPAASPGQHTAPAPSKSAPNTTPANKLPACRPDDLVLSYRAGGGATGNDLGSLQITNGSTRDCQLTGPITLTALDRSGQAIRVREPWRNTVSAYRVLITGREHNAGSAHWYALLLAGNMRNPAGSSTCQPSAVITPARWRVTGAVRGEIANHDLAATSPVLRSRLSACSDRGAALLLNVAGTAQP